MNFLTTYSGVDVDLLNPEPSAIYASDIARALSLICYKNVHTKHFYSVAQHSVNCYLEAYKRNLDCSICLYCLLNFAHIAYTYNLNSELLPIREKITSRLRQAIYESFHLDTPNDKELAQIEDIENCIDYYEGRALFNKPPVAYPPKLCSSPVFDETPTDLAGSLFYTLATSKGSKLLFAGVVRAKKSWISAVLNKNDIIFEKHLSIKTFVTSAKFVSMLIEMPIGFVKDTSQVRPEFFISRLINDRIIPIPCRDAIFGQPQKMAEVNHMVLGKPINNKINYILPAIIELDSFLQEYSQYKNIICESNAELCFTRLNRDILMTKKNVHDGIQQRTKLLMPYAQDLTDEFLDENASELRCAKSELLDALCLAVVARLRALGKTKSIPDDPDIDETGLKMQMIIPK